ncbi:DUF983 domain-containing protein [Sphingomonas donggukensis]|uniref:DUF983 domain-containing protein n=1 Tax=Sphingomonas donggukensis TaxID=2949093 RepID=A0ABY4TRH1_9SPHN|nr:DUF983 domain-containing protein [Sphingomonas donggukensis]URW74981.1 DUF983 domain-containing protein [Sphingomonas donggukensis]
MTDSRDGAAATPPTITEAGLKGLCPRCGAQTLFASTIRFAPKCTACGLDFASFNVGDGPAAFLTLGIGTLITVLAIASDMLFHPPIWLHLIVWPVLTLAAVVGGLRVAKGALMAAEYRNAAREGRIADPEP